jgi:flagellar biosynthesis chaperone FliJ
MDVQQQGESYAQGGIWTNENLDESLDWTGDTGGTAAATDKFITHSPKTKKQIEEDILAESHITPEVLSVISSQIESRLFNKGNDHESSLMNIVSTLDQRVSDNDRHIRLWREQVDKDIAKIGAADTSELTLQFSRIEEKLSAMEQRMDAITANIVPHGAEEARMIHEAYEIIKTRRATDESDTGRSEPSIFARFEKRIDVLNEQTKSLEPQFDRTVERIGQSVDKKRRALNKFGRL